MTTLRDAAMQLAVAGFRVFPLSPNSKVPALEADWKRLATANPAAVEKLWTDEVTGWPQPFNVGVALDADTLVVDVDVRDGKPGAKNLRMLAALYDSLPATYTVTTATGGEHRYFRVDGRTPIGRQLMDGIDLKTLGGYVVGPGSTIDGREYVADESPIVPLPDTYLALAERAPRAERPSAEFDIEFDTPAAIERATAWLHGDAPDSGTYKVAAKIKDFGISEDMAVELLCHEWSEPRSLGKDADHISVRVANAYRYGQSAPGVLAPEAEFGPVEVEDRRKRPKLYYERWRDATALSAAPYLIRGWYDYGAMVVTYGESGVGKTNVVLRQCFAIATGQPWAEMPVRQGLVVYVAAEGGRGVRKRIAAYKARYGAAVEDIALALVPCPVDLLRPNGDTKALIELIGQAEGDFGQRVVMVVLDTLSRVLAGGNENAPDDMGALVMHCDRIREATRATVHLIHHSGKNTAAGARGHSSLRAATDTEIEIGAGTIKGTKQRDMDFGAEFGFELETVDIGRDAEGVTIKSVVCHVRKPSEFEPRLSGEQEHALDVLRALVKRSAGTPDNSDITDALCKVQIGSRTWKAAIGLRHGDRTADKAFERDADALLANCDIECVAVKGKETLWNLAVRQTATKVHVAV